MIEIQRMNLNEIKNVNLVEHIGGSSRIKEEYLETYGKQYKIPKYKPKETNIEQLGSTKVYLDIDCLKDIRTTLNKWSRTMTLYFMT